MAIQEVISKRKITLELHMKIYCSIFSKRVPNIHIKESTPWYAKCFKVFLMGFSYNYTTSPFSQDSYLLYGVLKHFFFLYVIRN